MKAGILRFTRAARTLVDLARELRFVEAVVVADNMLHRGLTTKEEAGAVFEVMSEWRNRKDVEQVLGFADGRAESVLESYGRAKLHLHGITGGEPQVWLYDADGPIGRVDLYFRERRTVVEFDGLVKYDGDKGALRREKLRQERLEEAGFVVVRITFDQVRYESGRTAARVADGFGRAAHLSPVGWAGPAPDWAVA